MPDTDDPLDARLRGADPARRLTVSRDDFQDLLRRTTTRRSSRGKKVLLGLGVVGVTALGVGTTSAAADVVQHFLAQTGLFGDASSSEEDSSEWIDLLAPDANDYIVTLFPAYVPTPPDMTADDFKHDVADEIVAAARLSSEQNDGVGVRAQATGLQRDFEQYGYNSWIKAWLRADAEKDDLTKAAATRVLRAACSWPAFVSTDGGGVIARMEDFANAAETNDVTGVQAAAEYNTADADGDGSDTGWDGIVRTWWFTKHPVS